MVGDSASHLCGLEVIGIAAAPRLDAVSRTSCPLQLRVAQREHPPTCRPSPSTSA
ncbi:MAG: hypothetical protein M3Q48_11205 [Actinomycetota bacterium]|nr:hypothetical protein [Actinomycetota bacterium]